MTASRATLAVQTAVKFPESCRSPFQAVCLIWGGERKVCFCAGDHKSSHCISLSRDEAHSERRCQTFVSKTSPRPLAFSTQYGRLLEYTQHYPRNWCETGCPQNIHFGHHRVGNTFNKFVNTIQHRNQIRTTW